MNKFEVIVGNIGSVYGGNNYMQAMAKFSMYVKQSKDGYGRGGNEPVTLMRNGEIRCEYLPPVRCDQCNMVAINGVACHETGCINTNSRYDASEDRWIKQRKCFECGCTVDADDWCCSAEEESQSDSE